MIKDFSELQYGQVLRVQGDKSSSYYGHIGEFQGVKTFFGTEVAIVKFNEPKPLNHMGGIVESDLIFIHEIVLV